MTTLAIQLTPWLLLAAAFAFTTWQCCQLGRLAWREWHRRKLICITVTRHGHTIADYTGNNPAAAAQLLRTTATQLRPRPTREPQ